MTVVVDLLITNIIDLVWISCILSVVVVVVKRGRQTASKEVLIEAKIKVENQVMTQAN